jgi:hypothetical protein
MDLTFFFNPFPLFFAGLQGEQNLESNIPRSKKTKAAKFNRIEHTTPNNAQNPIQHHNHEELILLLKEDISESFLTIFTDPFINKIKSLMKNTGKSKKLTPQSIQDLPIKITKPRSGGPYSIRIIFNSKNSNPSIPLSQRPSRSDYIFGHCKKLIECLLFINKSVLAHLADGGKGKYQDEFSSHKNLINWLYNEIFDSGKGRYPLIGDFEDIEGIHFGECQIKLMENISRKKELNSGLEESLHIIEFYYKDFQAEIVKSLYGINADLKQSLINILYKRIGSNVKVSASSKGFSQLEGIRSTVMPFDKFPRILKPKPFKSRHKLSLEKEENDILEKLVT